MLSKVTELIIECIRADNKVLTFGVGGNATTAMHFAGELSGKFEEFTEPLPCICLCDNVAVITAITNDFGWEHVFERQIRALAKPGDVVVAFSISTHGQYLRWALQELKQVGCRSILVCGRYGEELDYCFGLSEETRPTIIWELGSNDTSSVQEEQLKIVHQICRVVKSSLVKVEVI